MMETLKIIIGFCVLVAFIVTSPFRRKAQSQDWPGKHDAYGGINYINHPAVREFNASANPRRHTT